MVRFLLLHVHLECPIRNARCLSKHRTYNTSYQTCAQRLHALALHSQARMNRYYASLLYVSCCLSMVTAVSGSVESFKLAVPPGVCAIPAHNTSAHSTRIAVAVTRVEFGGHCCNGDILCVCPAARPFPPTYHAQPMHSYAKHLHFDFATA